MKKPPRIFRRGLMSYRKVARLRLSLYVFRSRHPPARLHDASFASPEQYHSGECGACMFIVESIPSDASGTVTGAAIEVFDERTCTDSRSG